MRQAAVNKARNRLAKAEAALKRADDSRDFPTFEFAWTEFLVALNGVVIALEVGARATPQSRQWWFSEKANAARNDPLLSYLHQARNADEHGIDPVAIRQGVKIQWGPMILMTMPIIDRLSGQIQITSAQSSTLKVPARR